jgi:hypothetical protein
MVKYFTICIKKFYKPYKNRVNLGFFQVLWVSPCIIKHREGSGKHLDDLNPNGDFPVLHSFGIVLLVSGIVSYHIGKEPAKN